MLIANNSDIAAIQEKVWVEYDWLAPNGRTYDSVALYVLDKPIILVGVTLAQAADIELAFRVSGDSNPLNNFGGPGDDVIGATSIAETFKFEVGGGNDTIVYNPNRPTLTFDPLSDKLDFPPEWGSAPYNWQSIPDINGMPAIRFQIGDDSVTILGADLQIVNQLMIV